MLVFEKKNNANDAEIKEFVKETMMFFVGNLKLFNIIRTSSIDDNIKIGLKYNLIINQEQTYGDQYKYYK